MTEPKQPMIESALESTHGCTAGGAAVRFPLLAPLSTRSGQ
jgi:hypothetical protein